MELKDLPFTQRMQAKEANLRGLYLSIACDIDRMLTDVIARIEEKDPTKREEYKWQKIVHLELGKKLTRCENDVIGYNTLYYNAHKDHFLVIREFLKLRNMLTHAYSDFDNAQLDDTFIVFDWFEPPKKKVKKIVIASQMAELERFRDALMGFLILPVVLANEVRPK